MEEEALGGLTAEENAYFESGGENLPQEPEAPEPDTATAAPEAPQEGEKPEEVAEQSESTQRDEKGRFVPHGALHAEREEHKKTRSELNEMRERQARLEERWNMALQATQPKPEQPELPDPKTDPIAALEWTYEQIRAAQEQNQRQQAEYQQRQQQEQQTRAVVDYVEGEYGKATTEDPTVQEAFQHAFQSYQKELEVLGYRGPQLQQQMQSMLLQFQMAAANRMQAGSSIGDFILGVAESRGWRKAAEADTTPKLTLPDGLKKVAAAQEASRTIGRVAGSAGGDEVTLDTLDRMSRDEFQAWLAVPANARKFQGLMGG